MIFATNCFQSRDLILFRHQSCRYVEHLFQCEVFCIRDGMLIVWVIPSHEHRSFCFIVSNDKLLWPCSSLRDHNGLPRSITRYYFVHNGLRCSIVLGLLMKETWLGLACLSPRGHNGLPRSITHRSVSFPLLRRPSLVIIPLWVACWEGAFNRLFMIIVRRGFWVAAHNGFPPSILSLSFRTWGTLTFITSFPRTFWCRRWQSWGSLWNQTHHWSWLCCDSFFTWFFLCSFWHHSRTICRTEMANVEQTQKMIPFVTCEFSLG